MEIMFFFDFFNLFAGVQTKTRYNYKNRFYGNFKNRFLKNDARPVRFQIIEKKKSDSFSSKKRYFKNKYSKDKNDSKNKNKIKNKIKQQVYVVDLKKNNVEIDYYDPENIYEENDENEFDEFFIEDFSANLAEPEIYIFFLFFSFAQMSNVQNILDFNNKLHKHVRLDFIFFHIDMKFFLNQSENKFHYSKT